MIYLTADFHFQHRRILQLSQRPFKNIDEHDEVIIKNMNERVSSEDTLYILGDIGCHKDFDLLREKLLLINGHKHVILGNHDNLYDLVRLKREGVIEDVRESKIIEYEKKLIYLYHYPIREWAHYFKRAFHAYGHAHNNLKDYQRSTDVGVDAWNYYPVSVVEFFQHFDGRSFEV